VIAFVLGGAIGTSTIKDEDQGNGASRTAERQIAAADFPKESDEQGPESRSRATARRPVQPSPRP